VKEERQNVHHAVQTILLVFSIQVFFQNGQTLFSFSMMVDFFAASGASFHCPMVGGSAG
jgi:hypothetical protein